MRESTMKRRWLILLLVTSALAGLASGCGRGTPPTPTTPSSVSDSPATLTFPGQDWGYPSPAAFYPREPGYIRMSFLFDTLTWKDEAGIIPWPANGWEVSEDGTRWTRSHFTRGSGGMTGSLSPLGTWPSPSST